MAIPFQTLEAWSKPGKSENSKVTYEKLYNIIDSRMISKYEIFLQGSYHNATHVKENSDIDVVVLNKI